MDVALDDFADCESNLGKNACKFYFMWKWINLNVITAANRQTRMLADLALVNCYNKTGMSQKERDRIMLSSAKRNLAGMHTLIFCPSIFHDLNFLFFSSTAMSFFGLTEYQKISQYIFEETFNLRFAIPFEQHNSTLSMQTYETLTDAQKMNIKDINALDIELYDFAKELMFQR